MSRIDAAGEVMFMLCWVFSIVTYAAGALELTTEPIAVRTIALMAVTMIGIHRVSDI